LRGVSYTPECQLSVISYTAESLFGGVRYTGEANAKQMKETTALKGTNILKKASDAHFYHIAW